MKDGSEGWKQRAIANEEAFFNERNNEAMARLKQRSILLRKSPITGEIMTQEVIDGVVVDRCPTSGGIWLDKGELEQIISVQEQKGSHDHKNSVVGFLKKLFGS